MVKSLEMCGIRLISAPLDDVSLNHRILSKDKNVNGEDRGSGRVVV